MSRRPDQRSRAAAAALATILTAVTPSGAQTAAPPDFTIPKAESSPGEVVFSHVAHLPRVGKCSLCHMRDLKMKRGASGITLTGKQEGKFCGACHDGKPGPDGRAVFPIDECDRCHK
jgi:c(7)-type cytochrome triheme protein